MPFAAQMLTDEEEKKNQAAGGVNVSGQSTSFSTGVPGQEASGSSKPKSGSGDKFANIQSYLDANESQGDQMGQRVAGDVASTAEDATQKVQSFASKAPTVSAYDPSAAYQNVTSLSDNDKQAYRSAKAGYKGPQSIDQVDGYAETQKAASQAAQKYQNASTESGQQQLLKETYRRPSYSAGENALDQTLVQNSSGSKKAFEDLRSKYSGINSMFDTTANEVGGKLNSAIATGLQNQKKIQEGEARVLPELLTPIQQRAAELTRRNAQMIDTTSADLSDDVLSAETLAALGLNDGQKLWDMNLSSYMTPNRTQVGVNNAATADERARYAALTDLIDGVAGQEITLDGQAISPVGFERSRFDADLIARENAYNDAYVNQRGTVINPARHQGGLTNFERAIPGGLTDRRDINNASAKELEEFWAPIMDQAHRDAVAAGQNRLPGGASGYGWTAEAIRRSVQDWKNKYGAGRSIKKG